MVEPAEEELKNYHDEIIKGYREIDTDSERNLHPFLVVHDLTMRTPKNDVQGPTMFQEIELDRAEVLSMVIAGKHPGYDLRQETRSREEDEEIQDFCNRLPIRIVKTVMSESKPKEQKEVEALVKPQIQKTIKEDHHGKI